MHFCVCPIHFKVHWRVGWRLAFDRVNHRGILYKLCSVGIGGSMLSVLTQFLSNRSQHVLVDGCRINWLRWCQEGRRAVFWASYCSSCTPRSFFPFCRISLSVMPMTLQRIYIDGCCAVPRRQSCSSRVPEPRRRQGY